MSRGRGSGFQLVELAVALALATVAVSVAVPLFLQLSATRRLETAAYELVGVLRLARSTAIRLGVNAGVKFRTDASSVSYTLYRDGDGDGLLNEDIDSGVDPQVAPTRNLQHLGRQIGFGFPPGPPPRDPGDPSRRLDNLEDPIRFNLSDIASFSPLGGSTPGSLYLTDHLRHLAVVRVLGTTGRVRVLFYEPDLETWR